MATPDRNLLARAWVHAHEEDHDGLQVFKPLGTDLPPSRGRRILDLAQGGGAMLRTPGADDRLQSTPISWRLDDDRLLIASAAGNEQRFRIAALAADELVVQRIA
jgi:hypothetical protein